MNENRTMSVARWLPLGVALGDAAIVVGMLYLLYRTLATHAPAAVVAALAATAVLGVIGAAMAFQSYRRGRPADTPWLDRAMRGLAFVVVILVVQQVWTVRHRMHEIRADQRRLQELPASHQ